MICFSSQFRQIAVGEKMRSKSLPDDVVLDILLRLPVKSLKRFNCVCKSWCSNFEETDFVRKHYLTNTARGTNLCTLVMSVPIFDRFVILSPGETWQPRIVVNFSLLSNETTLVRETINIPSVDFPNGISMVDECEGLILLRGCGYKNYPQPVLLLNPATQELKTLPPSSVERPPNSEIPLDYELRLGYDCCTNDYKVLRIFVNCNDLHVFETHEKVELYTLSSNSWRSIANPFGPLFLRPSPFNTYLNGRCHWWMHEGLYVLFPSDGPYEGEKIVAFDMTQETFQAMEIPSCSDFILSCLKQSPKLRVFLNYLAVFAHSREKMGCVEIWVMKEYGVMESWTKQLVIGPIPGLGERLGFGELLGMWKTGEWFFETNERGLALFHPQTKAIKELEIHGSPNAIGCGLLVFIFTESLFRLNGK